MDEPAPPAVPVPLHARVRLGLRRPHNWFQLVRFAIVGASGYVINLALFAFCVHALALGYALSAVLSFVVAVFNNFWWNRHWTFAARDGHAGFQAARFFLVCIGALGLNLAVLAALVDGAGLAKVPAQAIAVLCATPVSFLGNKLWTFRM
jgi:dolichol-phosphate mannosyltransferase